MKKQYSGKYIRRLALDEFLMCTFSEKWEYHGVFLMEVVFY